MESPNGKILRLDLSQAVSQPEVIAYGLRNPWHFTFDPDGNLLIPDVGWDSWEELDILPATAAQPANFGWPMAEANDCRLDQCDDPTIVWPMLEWPHLDGNCGIIGGAVYAGHRSPDWRGVYVFGDYCSGRVWALRDATTTPMLRQIGEGASFLSGVWADRDGELLLLSQGDGTLDRMILPDDYADGWQPVDALILRQSLQARRAGINTAKNEMEILKASKKWRALGWTFDLYDTAAGWWHWWQG